MFNKRRYCYFILLVVCKPTGPRRYHCKSHVIFKPVLVQPWPCFMSTSLWTAEANTGNDIWTFETDLIQQWVIKLLRMLSLLSLCSTHTHHSKQKAGRDETIKLETVKGAGAILSNVSSKPCGGNPQPVLLCKRKLDHTLDLYFFCRVK